MSGRGPYGSNINLPSLDSLFSTEAQRQEAKLEKVQQLSIDQLFPFPDHPFQVRDDEEMQKMVESVKEDGVLTPLIARFWCARWTTTPQYAMLANSEFVVLLRQTKDIDSVAELYGLSEPQKNYLLLARPGQGILKLGNSLIPFENEYPKNKTYQMLTTKPGEMEQ